MPSEISESTADNRRPPPTNHHPMRRQEPEHLPCPRCNSTNTKFCYYNNYNFSQPRHFCKSCRRYWTHGGALRDIPVGGGSRKNAKRTRLSTTTAYDTDNNNNNNNGNSPVCSEYRHLLPPSATGPPIIPFGGGHGGSTSFTSLLNSAHGQGLFGHDQVCGFDEDVVRFGLGRTMWPFSGGNGGGGGWQVQSVDGGGGDCFVLPELAISTPGNRMK